MTIPPEYGAGVIGLGSAILSLLYIRRKNSRDSVEIAKDKLEKAQIQEALAELERLRKEEVSAARLISKLESDNQYLSDKLLEATHLIQKYIKHLPLEARQVLQTNFGALGDPESRPPSPAPRRPRAG